MSFFLVDTCVQVDFEALVPTLKLILSEKKGKYIKQQVAKVRNL